MKLILFLLLTLNILIVSIKTYSLNNDTSLRVIPNWLGTFNTRTECDMQQCCCIYGLITLSKMKPNYLRIVTQVDGRNCPVDHRFIYTISMPTGFQTEIPFMDGLVDITLSADSYVITLYNKNAPMCSGSAMRNNAKSIILTDYMRIILLILVLISGKNIFY